MALGILCARRVAIAAALAGGFLIAVAGAGLCADGLVRGGSACAAGVRAVLDFVGL